MWPFKRKTAEEKRLARHTKMMGRVQGDIVIKPIPFFTQEDLDQAIYVEESCQSCGTFVGGRYSYCDECQGLNQAAFIPEGIFGYNKKKAGLRLHSTWEHVPTGVVSTEDGEWVHEGGLSMTGLPEELRGPGLQRPSITLESLPIGEPV